VLGNPQKTLTRKSNFQPVFGIAPGDRNCMRQRGKRDRADHVARSGASVRRPVFGADDWISADLDECPAEPIGVAGPDENLPTGVLNPLR
jgi:hypothetical protein